MIPCGARVTLNAATMIARQVGQTRRVPMVVLDQHPHREHAERDQRFGPQAVVEGQPGGQEHRAGRPHGDPGCSASRRPRRGSTQRLSSSQVPMAARVAGTRIQTPAVLIAAKWASTDWYQSNGASVAPK